MKILSINLLSESISTLAKTSRYALAIMTLVVSLLGCSGTPVASGGPIKGQLLEWGSERPIAGAIVVAEWQGNIYHGTVCFHVASTTTDVQGRYHIPAWKKQHKFGDSNDQRVSVSTYKADYRYYVNKHGIYMGKNGLKYQELDTRTREQRLQYLLRLSGTSCGSQDESEKTLIPLRRAVYEEALSLVSTKEDEKVLDNILYKLEILELGFETAEKRYLKRD